MAKIHIAKMKHQVFEFLSKDICGEQVSVKYLEITIDGGRAGGRLPEEIINENA